MKNFTVDTLVSCRANGNMRYDFTGRIKKLYENAALVTIVDYQAADAFNARELQYMAVIAFKQMQVVVTESDPEDAVG